MAMCNVCNHVNRFSVLLTNGQEVCKDCLSGDDYFFCDDCDMHYHTDEQVNHTLCEHRNDHDHKHRTGEIYQQLRSLGKWSESHWRYRW